MTATACSSVSLRNLLCTRDAGHDGPHWHEDGNGITVWNLGLGTS
jgi:hypothetical protein